MKALMKVTLMRGLWGSSSESTELEPKKEIPMKSGFPG